MYTGGAGDLSYVNGQYSGPLNVTGHGLPGTQFLPIQGIFQSAIDVRYKDLLPVVAGVKISKN